MNPEIEELLSDILKHSRQVRAFVAEHDLSSYSNDPKTKMAVERAFEIIGEALNRIKPMIGFSSPSGIIGASFPSATFWPMPMITLRTGLCGVLWRPTWSI